MLLKVSDEATYNQYKKVEARKAQITQGAEWKEGESILDFKTDASWGVRGRDSRRGNVPAHSFFYGELKNLI